MAESGHPIGIKCLQWLYKKLERLKEVELYRLLEEEFTFIQKGEFNKNLLQLPKEQIRRFIPPLLNMALHKNVTA